MIVVGGVNILADNNSTPNVGTTVHKIIHSTLARNLRMVNVCSNCLNLCRSHVMRLSHCDISSVVGHNNAFLNSTHFPRFHSRGVHTITVRGLGGHNVSTLIIVNNSNSCVNTVHLARVNFPYVNLPNAVSGSVGNASCAVNFFATLDAIMRTVSHLHSASSSRRHVSIIRIVNHCYNSLALTTTVTNNYRFIIIPRIRFDHRSLMGRVGTNVTGNGGRTVITVARRVYSISRLTRFVRGRANHRAHTAILNRVRHNNSPIPCSHVLTSHVNTCTVSLLLTNCNNHYMNVRGRRLIRRSVVSTVRGVGHPFGNS